MFEEEVIMRHKELLRAYVSLQKENVGIQKRLNETVVFSTLEM